MPTIKCWQVDAFTDHAFGGNPAAICWLDDEAPTGWMQSVAMEMNLSETAFARRMGDDFELRWFTPTVEVDLCGHATLATAHALFTNGIARPGQPLRFHTRSGVLTCTQDGPLIELDFPALPPSPCTDNAALLEALEIAGAHYIGKTRFDYFVAFDTADQMRAVRPDFRKLGAIPVRGVIITAPSDDPGYDLMSRFFAPAVGVDEDPVCGSAHCALAAYWSDRLGKRELRAYQASPRGGILRLKFNGDRVVLGGQAVTVWQGELLRGPA